MSIYSIEDQIDLKRVLNKGGSSYIIEGNIIRNYKDLKRGQSVILKHCMGFLSIEACNEFTKEARILENLKENLVNKGKCNNFPIYYGYLTECIFGSLDQLETISKHSELTDLLFYYCNKPELGIELYDILITQYDLDFILDVRNFLVIPNFDTIASLYPLNERSIKSTKIQSFLEDEAEVMCSPNIIMSKIEGQSLQDDPLTVIDKSLLFDLIYTNMSLVNYNGHIFKDNNLGNIMIEDISYPKIYKVNSIYYTFSGRRLVIIDAQVTAQATRTRDLVNNIGVRCDEEANRIVEQIKAQNTIDDVINHILPEYFSENIISQDDVKLLLVAYPLIQVWSYP